MAQKFKEEGQLVRQRRESLGLDRATLASRLGLSEKTIQMAELGTQRLGAAANRLLEGLAKSGGKREVLATMEIGEGGGGEGYSIRSPNPSMISIIRVVLKEENQRKAQAAARSIGCSVEQAMELVVRNELEKEKGSYD